jgi:LacI family transcriptional regulator
MRAAVGHLLDLGHRRIGLIAGPEMRPTRERNAGAQEAYLERGISGGLTIIPGGFNTEHGEHASEEMLSRAEAPTALIAGGNQLLIGVLRTLLRRDLRFPSDVSLLTCDDTEITTVLRPQIGAVSRNSLEAGRAAADLLLRRLRSPDAGPETVMLETQFAARQSCAPPR